MMILYKYITHFGKSKFLIFLWKGIRVTMLFDLLTCIMQCCYIQCMIIQCLIFLLQFQFDFITFHFFFLQSCFRAFDICPSSHAGFSLCNALCHSSFYHYSYSVQPLFLLRPAIIASSMLTAIIHPDGASLVHRSQTLLWHNQCNGGYDQFLTAGTISSYGSLTWRTKKKWKG